MGNSLYDLVSIAIPAFTKFFCFYFLIACLFVCLFGFLTSSSTTRLYRGRAPRQERLTILRAATHETELGDHDFCLSRSHYTDTDPTCRERAVTAGIEPGTSSPGVARSTTELPRPFALPLFSVTWNNGFQSLKKCVFESNNHQYSSAYENMLIINFALINTVLFYSFPLALQSSVQS